MFTVKIGEQTLTLEQKTPILELISIENQITVYGFERLLRNDLGGIRGSYM